MLTQVVISLLLLQVVEERLLHREFIPDVKGMQAACDAGKANSCFGLGLTFENGAGVDVDVAKAKESYAHACDAKYGAACAALADLDTIHSDELLNKACAYKYGQACFDRAMQSGVEAQSAPWKELLQRACDNGFGQGCTKLAESENTRRVELLSKGCDLRDAAGCYILGRMYAAGNGVEKDTRLSQSFFDKACGLFFPAPGCKEFQPTQKNQ